MKNSIFSIIVSILLSSSAWAAGGYNCTINDKNLDFEIGGVLSHGIPSGPFQGYGKLQFKDKELQFLNIEKIEGPTQFWQWHDDLNVIVYNETAEGEFASFTMVIETKRCESCDLHQGQYKISVFASDKSKSFQGPLECWVD